MRDPNEPCGPTPPYFEERSDTIYRDRALGKNSNAMKLLRWVPEMVREMSPATKVALVEMGDSIVIVAQGDGGIVAILAEGHVTEKERDIPVTKFVQLTHLSDEAERKAFVKNRIIEACSPARIRSLFQQLMLGGPGDRE